MRKKLICVDGRTCSGKDSLVNAMIQKYPEVLKPVISRTTRTMREGEQNGVEHWFHTKEEFDRIMEINKDNIVAYTQIKNENDTDGYEYFTMKEDLEDANIYIIDPNGVKYLKSRTDLDMDIWVIYVYASDDVRRERAKKSRSDYETEYEKRVLKEKAQFDEAEKNFEFDYLVKNENSFENSLNKFEFYLRHIL